MRRIQCRNLFKRFHHKSGQRLLRSHIAGWLRPRESEWFYALKNISFDVDSGESLAIVGRNGAGKSTLLSAITGLARPDYGSIQVNGRTAALLELGSGFHPDLTGAENVRLNAALLGFTRKQTDQLFDSIVDFAGIADFIAEPLRTYSSGMVLRLAFSVAVNLDPDILVIDEVIAVGDQEFQAKCFDKIHRFRHSGKTIIAVSHATSILTELCDRALWLDRGEVMMHGEIRSVLDAYEGQFAIAASKAGSSE
jgi:ABC-type polysaccharide/polyol phosphate transport system ATPase subunit